jgi:hypothetical protein
MSPRPPQAPSFLHIECTKAEKSAWVRSARGKLSDWVRKVLNEAADKELGDANTKTRASGQNFSS